MCMKTYCNQCGLTTWKGEIMVQKFSFLDIFMLIFSLGCGQHIAQVLRDVPVEERCQCQKQSTYIIIENQKNNFLSYDFEI